MRYRWRAALRKGALLSAVGLGFLGSAIALAPIAGSAQAKPVAGAAPALMAKSAATPVWRRAGKGPRLAIRKSVPSLRGKLAAAPRLRAPAINGLALRGAPVLKGPRTALSGHTPHLKQLSGGAPRFRHQADGARLTAARKGPGLHHPSRLGEAAREVAYLAHHHGPRFRQRNGPYRYFRAGWWYATPWWTDAAYYSEGD